MIEEPIYDIDTLIKKLNTLRKEIEHNTKVYIKDVYSTDEYLCISDIRIDGDGDIIIENDELI